MTQSLESDFLVSVENVYKNYGGTTALEGVSLNLPKNTVFGVLGPNGAGKTTLVETILGLRSADKGKVNLFGTEVNGRGLTHSQRMRLAAVQQQHSLPNRWTVIEAIDIYSQLYDPVYKPQEIIEILGLVEKRYTQIQHLSGGQKQRVSIAMALLGNTDLIVMDEPTANLDPQGKRRVWELLNQYKGKASGSILLTTQLMEEAQELCDTILIIDHGTVIETGTPIELIQKHCPGGRLEFSAPKSQPASVFHRLGEVTTVNSTGMEEDKNRFQISVENMDNAVNHLVSLAREKNFELSGILIGKMTLEDVFLRITGRKVREN